jgi:hypothetical protein
MKSNNELLEKIAEFIEKYRKDKTMTSHRIAWDILKIIGNFLAKI